MLRCRKKKAVHKATTTDDKRLQSTLKRLNVNTIPSIEEVMLIKEDTVTVFNNPKGAPLSAGSRCERCSTLLQHLLAAFSPCACS